MNIIEISDREILETHFRKNTALNLYQLGDLDDFFFKFTEWYGLENGGDISHVVLIYKGTELPVLLALCEKGSDEMKILINEIKNRLPCKFYSHLSPGLRDALSADYECSFHGRHLKMTLDKGNFLKPGQDKSVRRLNAGDLEMMIEFYNHSYPGNWFDKRMLETGKYFGYFDTDSKKLLGISGIHVYSAKYRIAALGNISTDPGYRGRSICTIVTAALCDDLFLTVDSIGLNVIDNNTPAIRSYEKIGFRVCNEYDEYMFEKKKK
jgi:ribosomal protein S18 acetylase RimI-like enzyme